MFTVGIRDGREFAFALDSGTGAKLWATGLANVIEENPLMRWLTQRTPTVDGERVYAFSASGELFCLSSVDGRKMWQRNYPSDFDTRRHSWGFCDRPMVDGERLICTPFGTTAFITALDKSTGRTIWQTKLESPPFAGHAALVATEAGGVRQYIVFHLKGLSGFAADDGRSLWDYERPRSKTGLTYTPLARGEYIYSPNGYGGGLVAIQLVREGKNFEVRELYQRGSEEFQFDAFQDSTALVGDELYVLNRRCPACITLKTGSLTWSGDSVGGTGYGVGRAALTYADGCLYVRGVDGVMSLMQVSPQNGTAAGSFNIPEHEQARGATSPVVAGGRLYLRDSSRLFCYDISADAFAKSRHAPLQTALELTARELGESENASRERLVGVNRGPDAVYLPTPQDIAERMLLQAGVTKRDLVVDLGSGDGRIVIAAAKKYGCKAIGYEIDPSLVELSRSAVAKENLQELVKIEHADIFSVDLSGADVVTAFLYPRLMERLIPQFEKLRPGSRIISHQFDLPGVKPDRILTVPSNESGETHKILLWTTPLHKE
ncbi:MAG: outer membrane protein assembly factor BamB [Chthoniobacter sp.]|nr:outer membrane protein assembly factor BamB [Chthoniobacter sp.]